MSDENNRFVRSQGGHSANELHNHGGQDDAREDKTEREDLEEEIEELDEAEDTRVQVKTGKKIDIFDDDVEVPVDPAEIEPEVDPEDPIEEKKIAEAKKEEEAKAEEAIEEAIEEDAEAEAEPEAEEPINDWKTKEENQAYMQIDEVKEPKAKSGAGWKVATILFALLAIAGCGFAAYLSLFDGTTKFFGREITSKVEGAKSPAPTAPDTPNTTPIADAPVAGRYIYLDGYNLAIKVPAGITYLSYDYHQFNMGDPKSSTFEGNYSVLNILGSVVKDGDGQGAPEFIENKQPGKVSLGTLTIGRLNPEFSKSNNLGAPIMTTEDGRSIWYEGPQVNYSTRADDKALEQESITAIENWLTNKDNYIKL